MVTACRNSILWIKAAEKRAVRKLCPLAFKDELFVVPANYWVIKIRGEESYLAGQENNGEDSLLAFSSKKKAINFLSKIGGAPCKFQFLHFYWLGLVKKFKGAYKYVRVNERFSGTFALLLPLR